MRKRFGLPVLEDYPVCYVAFLRKIRDLRNLGVSEEKLSDLWDLERKLISILHLDLGGGELSLIEGCSVEADPEHRLLLSNAELGVPLMARDVQAGLDFSAGRPKELFDGKAMGEDALLLLRQYQTLLREVGEIDELSLLIGYGASILHEEIKEVSKHAVECIRSLSDSGCPYYTDRLGHQVSQGGRNYEG
jgi:hypothetical protein